MNTFENKQESLEIRVSRLERMLLEGKQVGTLYHVCSLPAFLYNIENNKLEAGSAANKILYVNGQPVFKKSVGWSDHPFTYYWIGKRPDNYQDYDYQDHIMDLIKSKGVEKTFISLTRDKRYSVDPEKAKFSPFIRIALDGDKISNSHAIRPYDYYGGDYLDGFTGMQSNTRRANIKESEELVESPLLNLDKYIISIEIDPSVKYAVYNPKRYGFTKANLNKFVKLCKQHNILVGDSKIHLVDAYKKICVDNDAKIDDKLIQKINEL